MRRPAWPTAGNATLGAVPRLIGRTRHVPRPLARGGAILAAVGALALTAAPPPALALTQATLARTVSGALATSGPSSGAIVEDLTSRTVLYASRADVGRIPASNEKLFTTATALLRFGSGARLVTWVLRTGAVDAAGRLDGDLVLRGAGDPTLSRAGIARLAHAIRRAGVRTVTGAVVGDESRFDLRRGGPRTGWAQDSDIGGVLGALTVDRGFAKGAGPGLAAARDLAHALRSAGIRVSGHTRTGLAPAGARGIAHVRSPAIARLIALTNIPSDNFYAETLLKDIGATFGEAGTTPAGVAVVAAELHRIGIEPTMVDGSGLARSDRTTPRQVVGLLDAMHSSTVAADFEASLAVAGQSGTLRRRMRGTRAAGACRGKTGTLDGVSALSGLCTTAQGHTIAYSMLMNRTTVWRAHELQDRAVEAIANYSSAVATAP